MGDTYTWAEVIKLDLYKIRKTGGRRPNSCVVLNDNKYYSSSSKILSCVVEFETLKLFVYIFSKTMILLQIMTDTA
jgi:hypothetical protein